MFQYWTDDTRESVVFSFHLVWLFYEAVQGGADTNELFRGASERTARGAARILFNGPGQGSTGWGSG